MRRRFESPVAIACGIGSLGLLIAGCGGLSSIEYRGGAVVDPGEVTVNVTQELIGSDDLLAAGADREAVHGTIDGAKVTLSRRAEFCSHKPDVVLDVDGATLKVRLVMPPDGEPCVGDENYLVTLKLSREFDRYELR